MKHNIISYLVSFLVPFALIGLALRALLSPAFLKVEYNLPGFPADDFGFTKEDRLHWAPFALNYLVSADDISVLADLKFSDGYPLFNARELSHLADVKKVIQGALGVWYALLALLGIAAGLAWRGNWLKDFIFAVRRGGMWTINFAIALGALMLAGIILSPDLFMGFFTAFHSLFFEGDSWVFLFSDTLIRLFPIPFWQNAFLFAAIIILTGGLTLWFGLKPKNKSAFSE